MTDRHPIKKNQRRYIESIVATYCPECEWCGNTIVPDDAWVIDHRVPWIALDTLPLHGDHWPHLIGDIVNMQPMHRFCNEEKGCTIRDADVRDLRDAWDDARQWKTMLYIRVLQQINNDARRAREVANLERQFRLFD